MVRVLCACVLTATLIQSQYRGYHDRQNFFKLKSAGMSTVAVVVF